MKKKLTDDRWRSKVYKLASRERKFTSKRWENIRLKVLMRDNWRCRACNKGSALPIHHLKPRSKGGTNALKNLETLCDRCHDLVEIGECDYMTEVVPAGSTDWHSWVYGGSGKPS